MTLTWLDISILAVISIVTNYSISYLKQKGKNYADKEDIKQITKLIEETKFTFTNETEKLKMELNIIGNTQLSIIHEQRNAIIDFLKSYALWCNSIIFIPLEIILEINIKAIDKHLLKLNRCLEDILLKETVVDMFVTSEEILKTKADLKKRTLENYYNITFEFLNNIRGLTIIHNMMMPTYDEIIKQQKELELSSKKLELFNLYNQAKKDNEKELFEKRYIFYNKCKNYLNLIVGKEVGKKIAETT